MSASEDEHLANFIFNALAIRCFTLISPHAYKPHADERQQFLGLGPGRWRSATCRRCLAALPPDANPRTASQDAEELGETAGICPKELFSQKNMLLRPPKRGDKVPAGAWRCWAGVCAVRRGWPPQGVKPLQRRGEFALGHQFIQGRHFWSRLVY